MQSLMTFLISWFGIYCLLSQSVVGKLQLHTCDLQMRFTPDMLLTSDVRPINTADHQKYQKRATLY